MKITVTAKISAGLIFAAMAFSGGAGSAAAQEKLTIDFSDPAKHSLEIVIPPSTEQPPRGQARPAGPVLVPKYPPSADAEQTRLQQKQELSIYLLRISPSVKPIDELRYRAEKGDLDAQFNLAAVYLTGESLDAPEPALAARWFERAANRGMVEAMHQLGLLYFSGTGVNKNEERALNLFRRAADLGFANSQYRLGLIYDTGLIGATDLKEALKWYQKAGEQGHIAAQSNLAHMYELGRGVNRDDKTAAGWYRKAADQGEVAAQYKLGLMYGLGQGVGQDYDEAFIWFKKAADQGLPPALNELGEYYYQGLGVRRDYGEAQRLFQAAAAQGLIQAQYNLDKMRNEGLLR